MPALTTPRAIEAYRLNVVRQAILLEAKGRKNSHGNITPKWAKHLGLAENAKHAEVIATIDGLIAELTR